MYQTHELPWLRSCIDRLTAVVRYSATSRTSHFSLRCPFSGKSWEHAKEEGRQGLEAMKEKGQQYMEGAKEKGHEYMQGAKEKCVVSPSLPVCFRIISFFSFLLRAPRPAECAATSLCLL